MSLGQGHQALLFQRVQFVAQRSSDNITLNQCTNYSDKTHKERIHTLLSTKPRILNTIISCFDDIQSFCINYFKHYKTLQ